MRIVTLAALLALVLPVPAAATGVSLTVTRGTTIAVPPSGLVPVITYTNEGEQAAGILHADGTVDWFTVIDGPEVGTHTTREWTRTPLPGGDVLLTDGTTLVGAADSVRVQVDGR